MDHREGTRETDKNAAVNYASVCCVSTFCIDCLKVWKTTIWFVSLKGPERPISNVYQN